MQAFPHCYRVSAACGLDGDVELTAERLPVLPSAPPAEFGGAGDRWSPETLLVGAVADCFVLTFRGIATASKLPWTSLRCDVSGTLDRIERVTQFTHLTIHAHLAAPAGTDLDRCRLLLEKAERGCLIANSLKATIRLEHDVVVVDRNCIGLDRKVG
jgi:organic hydroperoxide reductase OsmC/OhrA